MGFAQPFSVDSLKDDLFEFVVSSQIDLPVSDTDSRYNGLWWSQIENKKNSFYFGKKGKAARDANCFVSSMITNTLAELYLENPELVGLKGLISKSIPELIIFKLAWVIIFSP